MAAYNAEKHLEIAIESVINQTYENWELLIINDGSNDNTKEILKKYFLNPRIKIFHQTNKGQCSATNLGIKNATGDYIQFLDADDFMDKNKILYQIELHRKYDINTISYSNWLSIDGMVPQLKNNRFKIHELENPIDWITKQFETGEMLANSCYLIPISLVQKAGLYNENLTLNNDLEYFTRTVLRANKILFCDLAFTYYRREVENSLTSRNDIKSVTSEFEAKMLASKYLISNAKNAKTVSSVSKLLTSFLYSHPKYYQLFQPRIKEFLEKDLNIYSFPSVGGKYFKLISFFIGFENAFSIKNKLKR
jgi:glycosyltransferase involved in cell wall biosynthesis